MKKNLLFTLFTLALFSCNRPSTQDFEKGKKILLTQGFTEVECTGAIDECCNLKSPFSGHSTGFKAKNNRGEVIEGCFCSDNNEGLTIKFK